MDKSVYNFERNYDYGPRGPESGCFKDHNSIDIGLEAMSLPLRRSLETSIFLYYDGAHLVKITSNNEPIADTSYKRSVTLEVVPPSARVPHGLAKLLLENQFKQVPSNI
ncbi:MAG TPA: hypothetical protein VJK07_03170 [Candidatus Nanoarchaeia archaeon]|nr:hypothetical protein [Candidatus Nanoarchaeia archaeon]